VRPQASRRQLQFWDDLFSIWDAAQIGKDLSEICILGGAAGDYTFGMRLATVFPLVQSDSGRNSKLSGS
jgi:hypothetical protein